MTSHTATTFTVEDIDAVAAELDRHREDYYDASKARTACLCGDWVSRDGVGLGSTQYRLHVARGIEDALFGETGMTASEGLSRV